VRYSSKLHQKVVMGASVGAVYVGVIMVVDSMSKGAIWAGG